MLGLGYPGGAILEKMAVHGKPNTFTLPVPLLGQEDRQFFSYSGLKTSFYRLITFNKKAHPDFPDKQELYDLAWAYQNAAFRHVERMLSYYFSGHPQATGRYLLLGGGVSANNDLRRRLRHLGRKYGFRVRIPYTKKLCGDNAAMVGLCAYLNPLYIKPGEIDRNPNLKLV